MKYEYMYGSAAPKLPEQPQKEQRHIQRKPPAGKKAIVIEPQTFPLAQMIICIIVGFVILFTVIYRYSTITQMNCVLSELSKEYETLKDSNRKLQAEIGARINLENVRQIAEEKLNMKMPDSYQKIPVKVPKVNFSTVTQKTKEDEKSFKSLLLAFFQR